MAHDPGAYVMRGAKVAPNGSIVLTVVDLAGRVVNVAVPRHLTTSEQLHPVLRAALMSRPDHSGCAV